MPEEEEAPKSLHASLNRDQFSQYSHGIRTKPWPWGEDMYSQTGTKPSAIPTPAFQRDHKR